MVFISYRISDSLDLVSRLDADLTRAFGNDQIFRDKTRLEGGQDWTEILEYNAKNRKVMLVVIGPTWQTTAFVDGDWKGVPRLWNPEDWVRKEITFALDADNIVIPIFVNQGQMPPEGWLRSCQLDRLFKKQGVKLRSEEYERDYEDLLKLVKQKCPELEGLAKAPKKPSEVPSAAIESAARQQVRQSYLRWLVNCHERLEFRGIRHARGGAVTVELREVYLALQADSTNPLERAAARQSLLSELNEAMVSGELSPDEAEFAGWYVVSGSPIMPSIESRDRMTQIDPTQKEILNLGEAYFRESQLVVLGDPGSGKTTLARWLTLVLASACLREQPNLEVPLDQVDPTAESEFAAEIQRLSRKRESAIADQEFEQAATLRDKINELEAKGSKAISLGNTRVPLLVRIAEYAEERQRQKDAGNIPPTLLEFLGQQTWLGNRIIWDEDSPECGKAIDPKLLNQFCRDCLQAGDALVILDGLDEVPASALRDEIVEEVDVFATQWVRRRHTISTIRGLKDTALIFSSVTADNAGNRLLITSRIAGYHLSPLQGDLAHVTIEPMSPKAVAKFIRNWMKAIHQETAAPSTPADTIQVLAQQETDQFLAALHEPRQRGGRELATNPLLCGILATIFRQRKGDLPQERVALYHQAVEMLFDVWLRRSREEDSPTSKYELYDILEPIAEHVHRHEPTGLIPENQLKQLTMQYLAESRGENPLRPTPKLRQAVDEIVRIIREDVGLIAARGEGVYGFLHLTFQEYLAARSLVRDPAKACIRVAEHIGDSRWREAIRLALGHLNVEQSQSFLDFVRQLVESESALNDLLPQAVLTIVGALPDVRTLESELIEILAEKLLQSYQNRELLTRLPRRRQLLENAFERLGESEAGSVLEEYFVRQLRQQPANPERNAAIAHLLIIVNEVTPAIYQALHQALATDLPEWHFPIAALLRRALTPSRTIGNLPNASPDYDSIHVQPPYGCLLFRQRLLADHRLTEAIRTDYDWLRIIISLFGGVGDYAAAKGIADYHSMAGFLQQEDHYRERYRQAFLAEWGKNDGDFVYNMAVHLDTIGGSMFKRAKNAAPDFHPSQIHRESAWSQELLSVLHNSRGLAQLLPLVQQQIGKTGPKAEEAPLLHAILNSTFIDADNPWTLAPPLAQRLEQDISDAVARCAAVLPKSISELADRLPSESLWCLYEASMTLILEHGGEPNAAAYTLCHAEHERLAPYWLAESLLLIGQGWGDDAVYNTAVFLDNHAISVTELLECHTILRLSCNRLWKHRFANWPVSWLPPIPTGDDADLVSHHLLSTIEAIPDLFGFMRCWVTRDVLKTFIVAVPDLLPEILASALGDSGQRSSRDELFTAFAPELLTQPDAAAEIERRIQRVADPFHQCRALLRLASHWPERCTALVEEAARVAPQLQNPTHRQQIFEWLVSFVDPMTGALYWHESRDAAAHIDDPDNQARAWGRLACAAPREDAIGCLKHAYQAARRIEGELDRSNCIMLLRKISGVLHELDVSCREAVATITNPVLRARTEENWGMVFRLLSQPLHTVVHDGVHWAVLALAAELRSIEPVMDRDAHLWRQLVDGPCQARLDAIFDAAHGGLIECTPAVALCLQWLHTEGHIELLMQVYPRLRVNSRELVPFLRRQLLTGSDRIAQLAGLFWAELQGLSLETIPGVIESLMATDDLTRNRAAELLYGGPRETRFRASLIGRETLDRLFEAASSEIPERRNRISHSITWFCERLLYDAPSHIHFWAEVLRANPSSKTAQRGLRSAHFITSDVAHAIETEFAQGPVHIQENLLISAAHLAKLGRLPDTTWAAFTQVVNAPEQAAIRAKGGVVSELRAIRAVCLAHLREGNPPVGSTAQALRSRLAASNSFTWANVFGPEGGQGKLSEIGQMFYSSSSTEYDRWKYGAGIAKDGLDQPGFLELLTEWTIEALAESIRDVGNFDSERGYLIELLAGCAMNAPARWHSLAQRDRIQPYLLRATIEQNWFTGRCDAVRLLGYLRHLSLELLPALHAATCDVPFVCDAAIEAMGLFRRMNPEVFSEIQRWLSDESGLIAYATAHLMTAIGRHSQLAGKADRTATQLRRNLIQILAERVRDPKTQRTLDFGSNTAPTPEIPQLCDFLFDCMLKVAGFDEQLRARTTT